MKLIRAATTVPSVRVVASMREFEARYDPQLRRLQSGRDPGQSAIEIHLGSLAPERVADLWRETVGQPLDPVPRHLLQPHTLKLAVALGRPLGSAESVSLAFWKERFENAPAESVAALWALVDRMDMEESFWVHLPDTGLALESWLARGVLVREDGGDGRYAFAHQSLHEEARARRWLHENRAKPLTSWVSERLDTLSYRPKLRAILARLRAEQPRFHDEIWDALWSLGERRPSLRELLAVHLANSSVPSRWETDRMRSLLSTPGGIRERALQCLAGSEPWFRALEPWLAAEVASSDPTWLAVYLSNAWGFAEATLDGWLEQWALHPERRRVVLGILWRRKNWTQRGRSLLLRLATPEADEHLLYAIANQLEDGEMLRSLAVRYAESFWAASADDDPYAAPRTFPWERAAATDWVAFVEALAPAVARVAKRAADGTGGRHFAYDGHAWRHLDPLFGEDPLRTFSEALPMAAAQSGGSLQALVTLAAVDNAEIQQMLMSAYREVAEQSTEAVVDFVLGDERRLLLLREIVPLLASLGRHVTSDDRARLLDAISRVEWYRIDVEASAAAAERVAKHNAQYRETLSRAIGEGGVDFRTEDFMDDLEPPTRGGIVVSPYRADAFQNMTDEEIETTLLYFSDREDTDWDWDLGDGLAGGNRELCGEPRAMGRR